MRLAVFGGVGDDAERADFAVGLLWPHSEVAVRLADGTNQLGIRTRCDAAGLQAKLRLALSWTTISWTTQQPNKPHLKPWPVQPFAG